MDEYCARFMDEPEDELDDELYSYEEGAPNSFETAMMLGELDEVYDENGDDEGFTADELAILDSAVFRDNAAAIGTRLQYAAAALSTLSLMMTFFLLLMLSRYLG
jgi:hypothetical protein